MSDFCMYSAKGGIYERSKNGNKIPRTLKVTEEFRGCVRNDVDKYGVINRQNPELLQCDWVVYNIWGI